MSELTNSKCYEDIRIILENSRKNLTKAINYSMVDAYWHIGRRIVEEQNGNENSIYGFKFIRNLIKKTNA